MLAVAATWLTLAGTNAATAHAGQQERSTKLLIRYAAKSDCTVVPNYPASGVTGNSARTWTIPAGKTVIWRYNVDATWALVSDPVRASDPARVEKELPWWGFTRRDCIGLSVKQKDYPAGIAVPDRLLEGRSQKASGWRPVKFDQPGARVTNNHKKVTSNGTLRDPANFVVGNVFAGWHVHLTDKTRSNGHWVLVYVPNAQRWGYIERAHLI